MISVIGAGPSGSYYASLVSKNSEVHLFEEHKIIGKPVSCTGIVTDSIKDVMNHIPKRLIVSRIKRFKIISPNNNHIFINLKNKDTILDRAVFDKYLFDNAVDNGAIVHLNERFLGYKKIQKKYELTTNLRSYETDMIVGGDGPSSSVAKSANIYGNRKFVQGFQVRAKFPDLEAETATIYLNKGQFSWIVPEDEKIARIGIVGINGQTLHNEYKKLISKGKIIEHQSGIIPLYDPRQILRKNKENIYLIGDAATQVKATTYGGIIYGLSAAKMLAEDKESYANNFNGTFKKELDMSVKIRKMMNNMSDANINKLIQIFEKKSNQEIVSSNYRDYPSKFVLRLMLKKPKLWGLGFDIFKNSLINK